MMLNTTVVSLAAPGSAASDATPTVKLDLVGLFVHAGWPIKLTIGLLVGCSVLVWMIAVLKFLQLARLRSKERDFQRRARNVGSLGELFDVARGHASPGGRVVGQLFVRGAGAGLDRLMAIADRSILAEGQTARGLMWLLAFIAAGAPFIGLFGTVYGIMDAFIRIGAAKTASLPVVAPAIGEALITTAIGLAAAIPAVFFYNLIDKIIGDHLAELEAAAAEWTALIAEQTPTGGEAAAVPLTSSASARPAAYRARP